MAPSLVTAKVVDPSHVRVEWKDNSNIEDGFVVSNGIADVVRTNPNVTSIDASTLDGGTLCFTVSARSGSGGSEPSPPGCATSRRSTGHVGGLPYLRGYCESIGYENNALARASLGDYAAWDNWRCVRGNERVPLDLDAACRYQYHRNDVFAEPTNSSNAATWWCYAET